jgi:hypothetical protein
LEHGKRASVETSLAERAARNQALFRTVNERIERRNEAFAELTPYWGWVCECADTGCIERIDMTLGEYEELRADPTRFVVSWNERHVVPDFERVVESTERYRIVEKIGSAGEAAAELSEIRDALVGDHEYRNGPIA